MKITIAHLYYDLLNLYGESGNVKALKRQLEDQGIDVTIKFVTVGDELKFEDYDFVYLGMGTEENQHLVLKHLITYKKEVKDAIEKKTFFLVTGNSIELFGKAILDKNRKKRKGLGCFKYTAKEEDFRMVDEALMQADFLEKPILGFQNQSSVIRDNQKPMFRVIKGIGAYPKSEGEGIHYRNFYGTYLIGPILVRNPEFLKYMTKELILSKNPKFTMKKFKLELETNAYDNFIKMHYQHVINK